MKPDQMIVQSQEYGWDENEEMRVSSFMIRIWTQPKASKPEVRGWIEHIQSGERTAFQGWGRMLAIIAAHFPTALPGSSGPPILLKHWRSRLTRYFSHRRKGQANHEPI